MDVTLTKPIEDFIRQQIENGYTDPSEVIRQAMLRWMEEASERPPLAQQKLDEAARGRFKKGSRATIAKIIAAR